MLFRVFCVLWVWVALSNVAFQEVGSASSDLGVLLNGRVGIQHNLYVQHAHTVLLYFLVIKLTN